jgi:hypothetical protein
LHVLSHSLDNVLVERRVGLEAASCGHEVKERPNGAKDAVGVREHGAKARIVGVQWGSKALEAAAQVLLEDVEDLWMNSGLHTI